MRLTRKLLGYFIFMGRASNCVILDKMYVLDALSYEVENQILSERYNVNNERIKAGVSIDVDFTFDPEIPVYTEIPVYAYYNERNLLATVSVEIDLWIPSVDITDEQEELAQKKDSRLIQANTKLNRSIIGSVTATGSGILICDMDMIHLCHNYDTYNGESQIIAPPEGEESPGFRAGVICNIEGDRAFPVYVEYEDNSLKKITIEIDY